MQFYDKPEKFKPGKVLTKEWRNFKKGLNLLLRETELRNDEYSVGDNVMLEGAGVVRGRWGTKSYFQANSTGVSRGFVLHNSRDADGDYSRQILALTDEGYLAKKNDASFTQITGQSWPSGTQIQSAQLAGEAYIGSEDVAFTSYDGTNLEAYTTLSKPSGLTATNTSGTTGTNVVSYVVSASSLIGGTTEKSDNVLLEDLPFDLTTTNVELDWSAVSGATISGYEVYRGNAGDESYLAGVGPDVTSYTDKGGLSSDIVEAPSMNTTGGDKINHIIKYKDRLVIVPNSDPTLLKVSGRYPYHTSFSWINGGGSDYIDPDGGESITGLAVQPISDNIVVYKDHSSYLVEIKLVSQGDDLVLQLPYQPISTSVGCSSSKTIVPVENDIFYFGKDGMYVTGYEPNYLNIIRTNEVSAKVRPYFETLSDDDFTEACAAYFENRYILSFPYKKEMLVYDRERGSFVGVWKLPFGISHMTKYFTDTGTEKWVLGSNEDNKIYTFEKSVNSDDGTLIYKKFRTNKEDFDDWTLLSILRFFYVLFGDITGEVTVNILIEDRSGNTANAKTFTISGSEIAGIAGYGYGKYGEYPYGVTNVNYSATTGEVKRWGTLFKQASLVQIEVVSSKNNSNFEIIALEISANQQQEGSLAGSQRV